MAKQQQLTRQELKTKAAVRIFAHGSLAERFKAPVLKTGEDVSPP